MTVDSTQRRTLALQIGYRRARPLEVDGIVGISDAVLKLRESSMSAARGEASVLIRGPTGSGKELVPRAVHAGNGLPSNVLDASGK